MRLTKEHTEFTPFPQVTHVDMKTLNLNRILTNLNAYLKHYGQEPVRAHRKFIKVEDILGAIEDNREIFEGFSDYEPLMKKWLEDNFLDLVHRGHIEKQNIAAPVPLTINNYKLRNSKHCRDYGASEQLYTMLMYGSPNVIKWLRDFFHSGLDLETDKFDNETNLDIESLFLIRLLDHAEGKDHPDPNPKNYIPPFCIGQARVLADDVTRLLCYKDVIPRRILIDYLKCILGLHLGLHQLQILYALPELWENGTLCQTSCKVVPSQGQGFEQCPFPCYLLVDIGEDYRSHLAELTRNCVLEHWEQLNTYIRSYLSLKKLQEFGRYLSQIKSNPPAFETLEEIRALKDYQDKEQLNAFFLARVQGLMQTGTGEEPDEDLLQISRLGLDPFQTYIEMLSFLRMNYHRKYHIEFFDSTLMKNSEWGLMRQGRGRINKRRYFLGANLLETLLQIAVVEVEPTIHTKPILIDDFLHLLKQRYGILIDQLPPHKTPSILDLQALRENMELLKQRLRDIGFFRELSDSYKIQKIQPRFPLGGV